MTAAVSYPTAAGLPGVLRRFGAGCYDGLLIGGLLMVTVGIATWLGRSAAPAGGLAAYPYRLQYRLLALLVIAGYFGLSWTRSGETLGMKAWGLRLTAAAGGRAGWRAVAIRLLLAIPLWLLPLAALLVYMRRGVSAPVALACAIPLAISLAFAWRSGVSLHDAASATRVLRVPRDAPA